MSLRRSPRLTPAALAARRANAQKSTGPRTPAGKRRVAWNAMRSGVRTPVSVCCLPFGQADSDAYTALESALRCAIGPAPTERGQNVFNYNVAAVWTVKRACDRWIELLTDEDYAELALGIRPMRPSWCFQIWRPCLPGPGWWVSVTVSARWTRCPVERWLESLDSDFGLEEFCGHWLPRLHTQIAVMCGSHAFLRRRLGLRTKLECY